MFVAIERQPDHDLEQAIALFGSERFFRWLACLP